MSQENQTQAWHVIHNVIGKKEMQLALREVFHTMSSVLGNTLGPDGATTTIEVNGGLYTTKDGHNILKHMSFARPIDEKISQLLKDIAGRVVVRSGDGTTSSVVAAESMLHELDNLPETGELKSLRPKDIVRQINKIVTILSSEIAKNSVKVDVDDLYNEIYKLALIATNTDERFAHIIADIYSKTKNPMIDLVKSPLSNSTTHEIVEGYRIAMNMIDRVFMNNPEDRTSELENPYVFIFEGVLSYGSHLPFIQMTELLANPGKRPVLVVANGYDNTMMNYIKHVTHQKLQAGNLNLMFAHTTLANETDVKMLHDFAALLGGRLITYNDTDMMTRDGDKLNDQGIQARRVPTWDELNVFMGECERLSLGEHMWSTAIGFYKKNDSVIAAYLLDAQSEFIREQTLAKEGNFVNPTYFQAKNRFARLNGRMGVITVGGPSKPERDSDFDAIQDAVLACEAAYNSGYNVGGTLIVPIIIERLRQRISNGKLFTEENSTSTEQDFLAVDVEILDMLDRVFRNVFARVLNNRYDYDDLNHPELQAIVNESVTNECPYNMITGEYDGKVINPTLTDTEILNAAASIISVVYTSNQLVTQGFHGAPMTQV